MELIYADHAATTALDPGAFEAMKPYLLTEYGNASQPYSFARTAKKGLTQAREVVAACLHASADEIYFTSGGTESNNWAIKGLLLPQGRSKGVLTSAIEHHAVLNSCAYLERLGYQVAYLPVDRGGVLRPETLAAHMSERAAVVSVMLANNEIGTIQPIQALCGIAHQYHALFHTDAVQAVGHIPVDVRALGVDLLSASAHKFNGPKGIGFLYIRRGVPLPPFISGGTQERGMRAGTANVAGAVGMAAALQSHCENMERNAAEQVKLGEELLRELSRQQIPFCQNGAAPRLPGTLSLSFPGAEGEMLLHRLDLMGICVSTGSACDAQRTQVSHVLRAIHLDSRYAAGTIRVSLGVHNHPEDGVLIARAIARILKGASESGL